MNEKKSEDKKDVVVLPRFLVQRVHPDFLSVIDNQTGGDYNPLRLLIDDGDARDLAEKILEVLKKNESA